MSNNSSTFSDNLSIPISRWFRYSAGFSAPWVRRLINQAKKEGRYRVLDPFAGSGTVMLESEACNVESVGLEAHPFIKRVAQSKLCWREFPERFSAHINRILEIAEPAQVDTENFPDLVQKCFSRHTLENLGALLEAWRTVADNSPASELSWLCIVSILRECSHVGTAQWQYVLPNKRKARIADPLEAFAVKAELMRLDMETRQNFRHGPQSVVHLDDARQCSLVNDGWADLIITSPPYANNYDYADATRLEMSFLGEVQRWGDLQSVVRSHLVRSCTQHVTKLTRRTTELLSDPLLQPIADEMETVCQYLEQERELRGGKKPYHTMVATYFADLARVWRALRRVSSENALVCFVIGDSAPYGVHVPVERWLGELALSAGFQSYNFEKTRDRNIKWENRKHKVPLHEGRLWVEG